VGSSVSLYTALETLAPFFGFVCHGKPDSVVVANPTQRIARLSGLVLLHPRPPSRRRLHSPLHVVDCIRVAGNSLIWKQIMQRLKELTIVIPNRPANLARVLDAIARRGIFLHAISSSPSFDLNTVRLVLSDPAAAQKVLIRLGFAVTTATVLGIRSIVKQGRLSKLIDALAEKAINVDYLYGCAPTVGAETLVIMHVSNTVAAERALRKAGFGQH